ncbi:MAG: hypothetical protein M3O86_02830 [Actinomycetota bacterium]|nr:hypothetical protein [Actinomycetota bacterium]
MTDRRDADPFAGSFTPPLDASDPRFVGAAPEQPPPATTRRLERSRGPGVGPEDPRVRLVRLVLPIVALAGVGVVVAVFFAGLDPGPQQRVIGSEPAVRAAVAQRPKRVCFNDNNPCAWLTVVDDDLVAFNTNGPLPQEYGRSGVSWCPSSRWYGANATGSRFDDHGRLVRGPAPRGLDRFGVRTTPEGLVVVDFQQLTAGPQAALTKETTPAAGPDCEVIPFDRQADLDLDVSQAPAG